nr:hypothetical protein [Tanacetum cinerariifolium]
MGNGNQNQIGNGNLVAVRAEGNAAGHNGNQIRCYNCRGLGHFARDCTVRPKRRDASYLQTQLLIAQKEEAGIQLQAKEQYAGQNARNLNGYNVVQNVGNQVIHNAVQNPRVQNDGIHNQIGNGNLGSNFARDCTVRPRRRDAAYLQTQLLIAQKEEARIQLQAEEYDLMAAAADLDKIKEINGNYILMANLQ